MGYAKPN